MLWCDPMAQPAAQTAVSEVMWCGQSKPLAEVRTAKVICPMLLCGQVVQFVVRAEHWELVCPMLKCDQVPAKRWVSSECWSGSEKHRQPEVALCPKW